MDLTEKSNEFEFLPVLTTQTSSNGKLWFFYLCKTSKNDDLLQLMFLNLNSVVNTELLFIDPGILRNLKLSPEEKVNVIQRCPCQPTEVETNFPITNGRRFSSKFYWNELVNGERHRTDWLSYSILLGSFLYILHVFGKNSKKAWTFDGFRAWQRPKDIGIH